MPTIDFKYEFYIEKEDTAVSLNFENVFLINKGVLSIDILSVTLTMDFPILIIRISPLSLLGTAGRYSSVGSDVAWESRGTAIDPRVRHIFS